MTIELSITLDEERRVALEAAAKHEGVSPAELLNRLVDQRLEYERWFAAEVQKGIDAANAGDLLTHEEVRAHMSGVRRRLMMSKAG